MVENKLRILQIAPPVESVPPSKYGGTERVIHALCEQLTKKGHYVALAATGDSDETSISELIYLFPKGLRNAGFENPYDVEHAFLHRELAYQRASEFDIVHDHMFPFNLKKAHHINGNVVATLHGQIFFQDLLNYRKYQRPNIVSISNNQAKEFKNLDSYTGCVYNGLSMEHYPFNDKVGEDLLFVGRISPEKGVHTAIEVSKRLGKKLIIAAKIDPNTEDMAYYDTYIKPNLSNKNIEFIDEVDEQERNKLMSSAMAFLHPVTWREPFGLTMIESMATGCPVVAFNLGSIPEVVAHKKTGFVVEGGDIDGMVKAVSSVDQIDRGFTRKYVLEKFNSEKMADGYLNVYRNVIARNSTRRLVTV
jgi:glycosyltransferase involved in cell wall biosynthesis